MKKQSILLWAVPAALLFVAGGCKKDEPVTASTDQPPSPTVTNEQTAMQYYAATNAFVTNDEQTFVDKAVEPADYSSPKIDANVIPVRFGRFISGVTRTFTVTIPPGDSIAFVHVDKVITGDFAILAKYSATDTVDTLIQKPFTDHATRNIIFRRFARDMKHFWLNWVPVATSLVDGKTVPPASPVNFFDITIQKVQLFLPNGDSVAVTSPDSTYLRFGWESRYHGREHVVPELLPGQPVTTQVTVASASPDTDLVVLRWGFNTLEGKRGRMTLVSQSYDSGTQLYTRVYQKQWTVHPWFGYFHAGVDAVTHATIYDDSPTSYSASWWGVPYHVF